ncbi:MAG TPA: hypothetical protein VGB08_00195 [Allosphingosinicella sp.]|jgi:hypothetical protein
MRTPILLLALAPLLLAAANADDLGDAQCLVAYGQLGASEDAATRTAGMIGAQFYLGRLDGRGAASDLRGLLKEAGEAMKPADPKPALERCGTRLQQRTQALQAVGQALAREAPAAK